MKKITVTLIIAGVVLLAAGFLMGNFIPVVNSSAGSMKLETEIDSFAYAYGMEMGNFMANSMEQISIKEDFPIKTFLSAAKNSFDKKDMEMETWMSNAIIEAYYTKKNEEKQLVMTEQGKANIAIGKAFLEENKNKEGVITTESGLQYTVIEEGAGESPKDEDQVVVHYHGTLIDSTVFDSSVDRGEPVTFAVNQVIPGWTEALKLMKPGSKYKLFIPSELAYGERAAGEKIAPNSVLIFDVELIEIKPTP